MKSEHEVIAALRRMQAKVNAEIEKVTAELATLEADVDQDINRVCLKNGLDRGLSVVEDFITTHRGILVSTKRTGLEQGLVKLQQLQADLQYTLGE